VLRHRPADRLARAGLDHAETLFGVSAGPLVEVTAAVRLPRGVVGELRGGLGALVMPSVAGSASNPVRSLVLVPAAAIAAGVGWAL
jgi:hypothetical protein